MPSPFPGMDPWLESPAHWHNVHRALITFIMGELNHNLPEGFAATITARNSKICWIARRIFWRLICFVEAYTRLLWKSPRYLPPTKTSGIISFVCTAPDRESILVAGLLRCENHFPRCLSPSPKPTRMSLWCYKTYSKSATTTARFAGRWSITYPQRHVSNARTPLGRRSYWPTNLAKASWQSLVLGWLSPRERCTITRASCSRGRALSRSPSRT
jgi:hypothetical protein